MAEITPEMLVLGVIWYMAFLFSTTCHEAAHAWAALLGGDPTAARGGQVTLNPLPHIEREPIGMVLVPLAAYYLSGWTLGWASAPYDPIWAARFPRRAAWMAAAGPGANLLLVLLASGGIHLGVWLGAFYNPDTIQFETVVVAHQAGLPQMTATLLSVLFVLNLLLFLFNLIPVPPLDGASVITLFMSEGTTRRYQDFIRSWGMIGLLLAWLLFSKIFDPLYTLALNLLYPWAHYS